MIRATPTPSGPDSGSGPGPAAGHVWDGVVGDLERTLATDYRREWRSGGRPALLLVDLYNKVFGDRREPLLQARERFPSACGEAAWDALEPLGTLLATARGAGVPVVFSTGEDREEARVGSATRRGNRVDDAWGVRIVEPLRPRRGELVIRKSAPSAFCGTPLATHLRRLAVDGVVVAGESTSGCVRATAVDAYSLGWEVMVVEEATFDRSPLVHAINLYDLATKYAVVAHLEEAVAALLGQPSTSSQDKGSAHE